MCQVHALTQNLLGFIFCFCRKLCEAFLMVVEPLHGQRFFLSFEIFENGDPVFRNGIVQLFL